MTQPDKPSSADDQEPPARSALDEFLPEEFEPEAPLTAPLELGAHAGPPGADSSGALIVPVGAGAGRHPRSEDLPGHSGQPVSNLPGEHEPLFDDDSNFGAVVDAFSATGPTAPAPASGAARPPRRELTAAPKNPVVTATPTVSAPPAQDSTTAHQASAPVVDRRDADVAEGQQVERVVLNIDDSETRVSYVDSETPEFMDELEIARAARSARPDRGGLSRGEAEGDRSRGEGWSGPVKRTAARPWRDVSVAVQELAARFSRRDAAVITLCIVGLTELGWIGWRVASISKPPAQAMDARSASPNPGPANPAPTLPTPVPALTSGKVVPSGSGGPTPTPPPSLATPAAGPPLVAATSPKRASLAIRTDPAGALVSIDGTSRGRSPLTLSDLAPGTHKVVVGRPPNVGRQSVTLGAGESTSITVPFDKAALAPVATATAAAAPSNRPSGWVTVASAVPVELFEGGQRLGSSGTRRVALSAGRHELEAVNEPFGVRTRLTVDIAAGKTTPVKVETLPGTVNVNALPWATVRIDGAEVGDTPLANLQLAAGQHEVVFRHPELGERRISVVVQSGKALRVSMDLRKKS